MVCTSIHTLYVYGCRTHSRTTDYLCNPVEYKVYAFVFVCMSSACVCCREVYATIYSYIHGHICKQMRRMMPCSFCCATHSNRHTLLQHFICIFIHLECSSVLHQKAILNSLAQKGDQISTSLFLYRPCPCKLRIDRMNISRNVLNGVDTSTYLFIVRKMRMFR